MADDGDGDETRSGPERVGDGSPPTMSSASSPNATAGVNVPSIPEPPGSSRRARQPTRKVASTRSCRGSATRRPAGTPALTDPHRQRGGRQHDTERSDASRPGTPSRRDDQVDGPLDARGPPRAPGTRRQRRRGAGTPRRPRYHDHQDDVLSTGRAGHTGPRHRGEQA